MMRRADQLSTRSMLLRQVWGYKFVPTANLVDVHIGRLRQKVDASGEIPLVNTVRGAGFILSSRRIAFAK
jgi:two-component system, OmpR family, response regulator